ncbi:MAG: ABC transporter permease [Candidatus Acidiferrales bacterium]
MDEGVAGENRAMVWSETWSLALQSLRAHKMRAMLAMLSVVIGSACIVLVVTVALAGRRYVLSQIEAVGSNIVFADLVESSAAQSTTLSDYISLDDLAAVRENVPRAIEVAGTRNMPMTVVAGGNAWPVSLVGATPGFQKIRNLVIVSGRYLDDGDFLTRSKVCVVSEHLAALAFPHESALGHDLHVGELSFSVVGIFRERVATFGQSEISLDSVIIPFPLFRYYTGDEFIETFYAQAATPADVPVVTSEVAEILKGRHRPQAEYNVQNLIAILAATRRISLAMTAVLLLLALTALVVSGVGIMNIMLASVTERTMEIGIRKAIGARRREILAQFLLEGTLISAAGALIGIGVAVFLPVSIRALMRLLPVPGDITVPISWLSVVLAFVVSCVSGILFGYLPARRAARLEPVESLHYE